ncbi:Velvet factor [Microdochium nivale]|nr:Velvet factor [Microdochium nivale]
MDYNTVMAASLPAPSRDGSKNIMKRVTKGGKTLWYEMCLIQEPERARACGSGPKSSADRRPVDPPPVIQFRVFEGEDFNSARDVTMDLHADFFAYTSLEQARPMASGRLQAQPPVLSGLPVAGCSWLDRPHPAGYFIFPDLSVRHEGLYKLVFTLYELTKDPMDADVEGGDDEPTMNDVGQAWYCRMEVTSGDFTVYSAKKFPGLTESTNLSRTVAEQGCRVRIRRDVRMRRRDRDRKPTGPGGPDKTGEDNFGHLSRNEPPADIRPRSDSIASMDPSGPYGMDPQRRPSIMDHRAGPGGPLDFASRGGSISGFIPPPSSFSHQRASPAPSYSSSMQGLAYPPLPSPTGTATPGYPSQAYGYIERPLSRHEVDSRRASTASYYAPIAPAAKVSIPANPRSSISLAPYEVIARNASIGHREQLAPDHKGLYAVPAPAPTKRRRDEAFYSREDARLANHQRPVDRHDQFEPEDQLVYRRADGTKWHAQPDGSTGPIPSEFVSQ